MSHLRQQVLGRSSRANDRPTNEIRPPAEKYVDQPIAGRSLVQATVYSPSAGGSWEESCGGCPKAGRPGRFDASRFLLASPIAAAITQQIGLGERWLCARWLGQVNGPKRAADAAQLRGIFDLLMAQKLRPSPAGSVGEILHRPFSLGMPPSRRLLCSLPQEG